MLYEFARDLAQLRTTSQVIETTEEYMSRQFKARVAVLVPDATGTLVSPTGRGMTNPFDSTAAQWAFDQAQSAGAGTETLAGNEYLFLPLKSPTRTRGVLAVRPERARDLFIPEQRHQFEIFATLVATALERVHYVDVARDAMLMAGIQSGEIELELGRRPVAEIVDAGLRSLGALLAKHKVAVEIPADLPQVPMDAGLMQRVFASLAGNVARHTPAGTHLNISARESGEDAEVVFEDDGPGLPKGREEEIFDSFARGEKHATRRGAGLGLAISRAIVTAHGGTIRAEVPESGKGSRIAIRLPMRRFTSTRG
jgi:two-component system sensor histidine kinase KdpD